MTLSRSFDDDEKWFADMFSIYDIFLVWILTLFLQIQGEGEHTCSQSKKAECEAVWRTCVNEQCGACFLEIHGECYNPNYAKNDIIERLESCDPLVDPECKRNLEDVRQQLLQQLGNEDVKRSDIKSTNIPDKQHTSSGALPKSNFDVTQPTKPREKRLENENINNQETADTLSKEDPVKGDNDSDDIPDVYFLIIIIACTLSGVAGIALSGYCWYKLHYSDDKVNKSDYIPGVKKQNSTKSTPQNGDRKLDYKAEMYHYVHTKNQIAAMERAKSDHLSSGAVSNDDDDDEDEAEDYTVYECPGLAPTGDMTVVNPLFSDQEISVSDEGRVQSTHSSPTTPSRSNHSPSR
ncbi:protein cab-1-like [Dendronephthya gigantea]|uniref:protein cab-1-like n=1 Tax=Dendronephthya gigantea TaxID=151771 RepID=UPI00106C0A7D|nr:protein cab-1-like [Dendronephthya gigantea]